ncbi:MAG: methyltransferase type 11 [Citrobacter freundii]|nr:MAG: methyltransferase type 11 [Citrobacter freundii]
MTFTAHNVKLNNGQTTMPSNGLLLENSAMWTSIAKSISLFVSKENRSQMRAVDLGCLEGGYSVELAKLGFDTLGIEARAENVEKCNYVKNNLQLDNLHFATDDVRNLPKYGKFDITICYGLLYHLNDPISFLKTVSNCTTKILFLNTHFAPDRDFRYNLGPLNRFVIGPIQKRTKFLEYRKNFRLSPMTENEGYAGRWYREWSKSAPKAKVEKLLWASYNNDRSFWVRKKDLTQALHEVGFNSVFEQFDYTGDILPDNYTSHNNRTMFVAVKH